MHGVFLKGNLHWQVYSNGNHSISFLNLNTEVWEDLEGPDDDYAKSFWINLGIMLNLKFIVNIIYHFVSFFELYPHYFFSNVPASWLKVL